MEKKIRNAHAGFSSFELNFGKEPIFVNCGGGSRFGFKYRNIVKAQKHTMFCWLITSRNAHLPESFGVNYQTII